MAFGVLTCKPGASFPTLAPAGFRILAVLDDYARVTGQSLTITSGSEARGRDAHDPHMLGEAVDVSVHNLSPQQIIFAYDYLRSHLGASFTVLYEVPSKSYLTSASTMLDPISTYTASATAPHLHIQRKKGIVWP